MKMSDTLIINRPHSGKYIRLVLFKELQSPSESTNSATHFPLREMSIFPLDHHLLQGIELALTFTQKINRVQISLSGPLSAMLNNSA